MLKNTEKFLKKYVNVTEEYKFYNDTITLRYDVKKHIYYRVEPEGLIIVDGVTNICKIIDKSNVLIPWACKMMELKLHKLIEPFVKSTESSNHLSVSKNQLDMLITEAKSAHKDKLEEAGTIGKAAHSWIEDFIKTTMSGDPAAINQVIITLPEDKKAQSATTAALDWINKHNVRWICTERKVYSRSLEYAGTMDGLCHANSCNDPKCCPVEFKDRLTLVDWKTSNYLYKEYILQTAAYKKAYEEETKEVIEDVWIIRLGKTDSKFEAWHLSEEMRFDGLEAFTSALSLTRVMKSIETAVKEKKKLDKD